MCVCVYACVTVWFNYGGPSEFMKTMERMYTLASQLGTFNITHTMVGGQFPEALHVLQLWYVN